ncbi:hypothetical protein V3C99_006344 [Haemonchus contortus]
MESSWKELERRKKHEKNENQDCADPFQYLVSQTMAPTKLSPCYEWTRIQRMEFHMETEIRNSHRRVEKSRKRKLQEAVTCLYKFYVHVI